MAYRRRKLNRCPACRSTRYKPISTPSGNGFRCFKCGFINIRNPKMVRKESKTPINGRYVLL